MAGSYADLSDLFRELSDIAKQLATLTGDIARLRESFTKDEPNTLIYEKLSSKLALFYGTIEAQLIHMEKTVEKIGADHDQFKESIVKFKEDIKDIKEELVKIGFSMNEQCLNQKKHYAKVEKFNNSLLIKIILLSSAISGLIAGVFKLIEIFATK